MRVENEKIRILLLGRPRRGHVFALLPHEEPVQLEILPNQVFTYGRHQWISDFGFRKNVTCLINSIGTFCPHTVLPIFCASTNLTSPLLTFLSSRMASMS